MNFSYQVYNLALFHIISRLIMFFITQFFSISKYWLLILVFVFILDFHLYLTNFEFFYHGWLVIWLSATKLWACLKDFNLWACLRDYNFWDFLSCRLFYVLFVIIFFQYFSQCFTLLTFDCFYVFNKLVIWNSIELKYRRRWTLTIFL